MAVSQDQTFSLPFEFDSIYQIIDDRIRDDGVEVDDTFVWNCFEDFADGCTNFITDMRKTHSALCRHFSNNYICGLYIAEFEYSTHGNMIIVHVSIEG